MKHGNISTPQSSFYELSDIHILGQEFLGHGSRYVSIHKLTNPFRKQENHVYEFIGSECNSR